MTALFTGRATADFCASTDHVFEVATSLERLEEWLSTLQRVRIAQGGMGLGLGAIFLADESFAESPLERDRRFQVTSWVQGESFGFRSLDDATMEALLHVHGSSSSASVTWTVSGSPARGAERLLASVMRRSVERNATRQAAQQLSRLAQLVQRSITRRES